MKFSNPIKKIPPVNKALFAGLGLLLLLVLASFVNGRHENNRCKRIIVNILDQDQFQFVKEPTILRIVNKDRDNDLVGRKIAQVDLHDIETRLLKNSFIKDAQAYFDMEGNMTVDVHQRRPILRAIDPLNQSYYIDDEGKRMPLNDQYTTYVPIATPGNITTQGSKDSLMRGYDSSLFVLAQALQKDSFMRALTGQIVVSQHNEITIIPRLGNFEIGLGDVSDLEDKFLRLRSFYQVTLPAAGWNTYKRISVKYKNQIIANR
jgi:cell division protein FtsQ